MRQKALGWINNISHGIHMFWVMEAPDMYRFVLHQVLCVSLCLLFVNLCFGFNRCCGLLCFKKKYFVAKNQVKCKSNYENKNQQDHRCLYGGGPRSDVLFIHHSHRGSASRFRERKWPLGNFLLKDCKLIRVSTTGDGKTLA